jgi:hypothetical protein
VDTDKGMNVLDTQLQDAIEMVVIVAAGAIAVLAIARWVNHRLLVAQTLLTAQKAVEMTK